MNYKYLRLNKSQEKQEFQLDKLAIQFDKEFIDIGRSRVELYNMTKEVKEGDTVYFESIARVVTDLKDLARLMEQLVSQGARGIILKEQIDTTTPTYKTLLDIVGALNEIEKINKQYSIIKGVERCRATGKTKSGKWFGREEKTVEDLPREFSRYYKKLVENGGNLSKIEVAKLLNISRATLYRWIKIYEKSQKP